jgi:MFS family permease
MISISKDRKTNYIILEGMAYAVIISLLNNYVMMFAKRMGAHDLQIALISSLPPLVAIIVLIPCGILIEKMKSKRAVAGVLILINSIFFLMIAFVPFIPNQAKLTIYVIIIGLMNWPGSLYVTVWQSFFSDNFTGDYANRVYSLRSKYSTLIGLVSVLLAGYILSAIPKNENDRIIIYQFFFIACFVISIMQVFFLSQVKNGQDEKAESIKEKSNYFRIRDIKEIFSNKTFMFFSFSSVVFHFAWQACWPLFFIYHVDYVKVNEFQLGIIGVASGLAAFISYSVWSKMARIKGNSLIIVFGALGLAINPFLYLKVWNFYTVVVINVIIGVSIAGFTLTLFCRMLEVLPEGKKTVYISFFNTLVSITGFTAPLLSIWMLKEIGIFLTFLLFGILRLIGTALYAWGWHANKRNGIAVDCVCKPGSKQ